MDLRRTGWPGSSDSEHNGWSRRHAMPGIARMCNNHSYANRRRSGTKPALGRRRDHVNLSHCVSSATPCCTVAITL
jgi:hypothetical protein